MIPDIHTPIPGPKSLELADKLGKYESRNVTYTAEDWPVFWQRAEKCNVWDVDGNRYIDVTSAFGVSGLGHRNPDIVAAMQDQSDILMHGMGDVHPTELKVQLCEKLSELTFERWGLGIGKTVLSNSGFEAVEAALKTAYIASQKAGVISFKNGYHGLGYGALLASGFEKFKSPFDKQLANITCLLDFPSHPDQLDLLKRQLSEIDASKYGAMLLEPIQGRGGKIVPPEGFLTILREWCDEHEVILIFDEIYTGFNRSGKLYACEWDEVYPDIICLGKALSGGYPLSACVGKSEVMDQWPESTGEALHTSTFLGNPVGCAMALAALDQLRHPDLAITVEKQGIELRAMLEEIDCPCISEIRGRGLMVGLSLYHLDGSPAGDIAGQVLSRMLARGVIMLADAPTGHVLSFTPPFYITLGELIFVVETLKDVLTELSSD